MTCDGYSVTFKTASSPRFIQKLCDMAQKHKLYAKWHMSLIKKWVKDCKNVSYIVLAYVDDAPVGICLIHKNWRSLKRGKPCLEVSTFVQKQFRGHKLGTKMFKKMPFALRDKCDVRIPQFSSKDGRSIYNCARSFYRSLGKLE